MFEERRRRPFNPDIYEEEYEKINHWLEVGHELFYRIKEARKSEELQKKEMSILHYSNREVQSMRMESGSNLGNSEKKITIHIT